MNNPVLTALDRAIPNNGRRPLNILTTPTHEGYQTNLSKTGHNFYMLQGPGLKQWDFHTRPLPPNHYLYTDSYESMGHSVPYDVVLCQNVMQDYALLRNAADKFQLPLVILDHTEPPPGVPNKVLTQLKELRADARISITSHNRASWGLEDSGIVIPHGIDLTVFKGYCGASPVIANVSNHFEARNKWLGYEIFQTVTKQVGVPVRIIGENPSKTVADGYLGSISDPAALAASLAECQVYLNTTTLSPLPLSLLEAMGVGLPIVTTANQQVPDVVRNGIEGFISNEVEDLVNGCGRLLESSELRSSMGAAARERIRAEFSMEAFVSRWNEVLDRVYYGA